MALDKDTLLKHRFWILLGLAIPIIIAIVIIVPTSVGGETETKKKKVESTLQTLNLSDPKNEKWIEGLSGKEKTLDDKRKEVWKAAWDAQAEVYTWPRGPKGETELDALRNAAFGDPIDRYLANRYVRNNYAMMQALEILKIIDPVTKAKPDGTVQLRNSFPIQVVSRFKREEPSAEEIWLAQEDLWVQRELLQIVREANDSVAEFRVLPNFHAMQLVGPGVYKQVPETRYWHPANKGEIRQRFYNPYWELDLVLVKGAKEPVLRGTIKNISRRKLPQGILFNVHVKPIDPQRKERDVGIATLSVDGEAVPAGKTVEIKDSPSLVQSAPDGLFGVEQQFTWRTAPVKRLDAMALSKSSHRTAHIPLKPAQQFAATDKPQDPAASSTSGTPGARGLPGSDPGADGPAAQPGSLPGAAGQAASRVTESGLRKDRYIHVTEQVRRMPVALTVTVEQAHIPNVVAAFSNSRLRMQVTQVHMIHVRGDSLRVPEAVGQPGDEGGQPLKPGSSRFPLGGERGSSDDGGNGFVRPGVPPNIGFPAAGAAFQPPGGSMPRVGTGEEDEGNLVELTVYAIASLYERYRDKPAAAPGGTQATGPGGDVPGKPVPGKP